MDYARQPNPAPYRCQPEARSREARSRQDFSLRRYPMGFSTGRSGSAGRFSRKASGTVTKDSATGSQRELIPHPRDGYGIGGSRRREPALKGFQKGGRAFPLASFA
jgi:hypothetical protein